MVNFGGLNNIGGWPANFGGQIVVVLTGQLIKWNQIYILNGQFIKWNQIYISSAVPYHCQIKYS